MADGGGGVGGANVRVVRCPNCQKLLPEIGDVAVYRCGGCDSSLQAKRPYRPLETSIEATDVQRRECDKDSKKKSVVVDLERPVGLSEGLSAQFDGASHKPVEVRNGGLVVVENVGTGTHNEGNGAHYGRHMLISSGTAARLHGNSASVSDVGFVPKEPNASMTVSIPKESLAESSGSKFRTGREESTFVNGSFVTDARELPNGKLPVNASHVPQQLADNGLNRNLVTGFPVESEIHRTYPSEGPSNYNYASGYRYSDCVSDARHDMDAARRVGYLEQNRAQILRMLDELRDQVQRTCKVSDKQQGNNGSVDGTTASSSSHAQHDHANLYPESSSSFNRNPSRRSPLYNYSAGMMSFHPNLPIQHEIPCYPDPLGHRRPPPHLPGEHPHRQADSCFCGQCDPDFLMPYHHDSLYNQPACSCLQCHQRQFPMPAHGPTTVVGQQRVPYFVNNHDIYPTDGPSTCAPRGSNTKTLNAPLRSLEKRTRGRTAVSRNDVPYCRPISGAAPFSICFNCHELLQLPEQSFSSKRIHFKLCCGSCSAVIAVKRVGNRLVASAPVSGSNAMLESNNNSCDNSDHDIQSTDEKLVLPYTFDSEDHEMVERANASILMDSDKMLHFSSSSNSSKHRDSSESMVSQNGVPSSSEIVAEAQVISRVSSLPLREHFGFSPSDSAVDRSGHGSRSARSDQERKISLSENLWPNLAKDLQMPIVMDVPADEYPPAGFSQDSWDMINKDDIQPRVAKGGDSFITGFIKKSFKINQVMSHARYKVSINGHPISDRLIKKAEKLAGPITPGDYWYDYRAGFWGAMGHQCLGIIPPFIEEFNYPMAKKCSGGDTGILVNGRELHQKDLDLLLGRGLPDTKGRSYTIEISGKVWDESSGEELDGLGKLAPTVERLKRGFGMQSPRGIA